MKRFLFALLLSTRALNFVSWLNRRKVTILCYHSVTGSLVGHDPYKQHVPLPLFLEHLDHLQSNYRVISLADFLRAKRENRRLPDYSVVLIFDDGFQDFLTVAADHLALRKLSATVFVITDRTHGSLPPNGESFLSWQEVQELAASGIQVGSHTCSHPRLLDLPFDELRRELADARTSILSHVGQEEVPLSYPYGQASEAISKLAQSLGYSCGITGVLGPNGPDADVFLLNRTVIASDDDLATFAARVSGLTWWASRLRWLIGARNRKDQESGLSPSYGSIAAGTYDYPESAN
ncbi:MAG TPA: polysaccharide deacetylase family protein [Pyrinomonadaceae bacterium]|nr:polysaccharide deacetylase family protein [Pyrinomonadaceae bacterium]